jgi:hypothetical protein
VEKSELWVYKAVKLEDSTAVLAKGTDGEKEERGPEEVAVEARDDKEKRDAASATKKAALSELATRAQSLQELQDLGSCLPPTRFTREGKVTLTAEMRAEEQRARGLERILGPYPDEQELALLLRELEEEEQEDQRKEAEEKRAWLEAYEPHPPLAQSLQELRSLGSGPPSARSIRRGRATRTADMWAEE